MTDTLLLGHVGDGAPVHLPLNVLLRHVVVLGSSGSGKTVACKVVVEEAVRQGISVIAIDPQGDLASLGLIGNVASNVPVEVYKGYWDKLDLKIWTPGSTSGRPLCVSPIAAVAA